MSAKNSNKQENKLVQIIGKELTSHITKDISVTQKQGIYGNTKEQFYRKVGISYEPKFLIKQELDPNKPKMYVHINIYVLTPDGTNNADAIGQRIEKMLKDHINYESDVQLIKHVLMKKFNQKEHDFQANIAMS